MSSQRSRLHGLVHAAAALALASVLAWPAAAAELPLNTTFRHAGHAPEPGEAAEAAFRIEIPQAGLLVLDLTFADGTQPAAGGTFIQKDVDPWDDDLDGKKPPPPPRVVFAAGSSLQFVPRDDGGLVAFTQSEGEVESLKGDQAVYVLILRRPTRP